MPEQRSVDRRDFLKSAAVTEAASTEAIKTASTTGQFSALGKMAMFPAFMLVCYIILIVYFSSKGGYKPLVLATA